MAAGDIDKEDFHQWLPDASAGGRKPVDILPTTIGWLHGTGKPAVFESFSEYDNAIAAAKIDVQQFPFCSILSVSSHAALGRSHSKLGQVAEANAAFQAAIKIANRCELRMQEVCCWRDLLASHSENAEANRGIDAAVANLSEEGQQYQHLLTYNDVEFEARRVKRK